MRYLFPTTKFVKTNTIGQQLQHVFSESMELQVAAIDKIDAVSITYKIDEHAMEEAVDLYHSLETLFRIWESQGVDMEAVMQKELEKNRDRGYYTPVITKYAG